jgi:NADH-quinone oxidoreductase subunit N
VTGVLDLRPVWPALVVAVGGLAVLLVQAFTPRGGRAPSAGISVAFLGVSLATVAMIGASSGPEFAAGGGIAGSFAGAFGTSTGGAIVADHFALAFQAVVLLVGVVAVLLSPSYLAATGSERGEVYALMLFSITGMMGLVSSLELISAFLALEIMSVALYALAGVRRDRAESQEAALKYFVTGAFSSAFFLYGVALLYGVSGTTSLPKIARAVAALPPQEAALPLLGAGMLLVGFGFKVASVPFHMWAPDVYQGAPTTITGFMAAGVKVAAFGALLRVFGVALPALAARWQPAVAVLAIVSMVGGNLGALAQRNVKRMLAYSSIAHAGYLLTGLVAAPRLAGEALLFYLIAYAAVNLGGFGALAALAKAGREPLTFDDLAGLAQRRPALAAALTVFLVSLTGIPVSAGFVGKFYLFRAAVYADYALLAVVGVLMSVVSAYYYLGVVVAMYMKEPVGEDDWGPVGLGSRLALAAAAAVVLIFGVYPGPALALARAAASSLP